MTPAESQDLQSLLSQVLERAPVERETFARQICLDDDTLPELIRMLHSAEHTHSQTTTAVDLQQHDDLPAFSADEVLLDRFRIVRFLGKGGMGEVYEAADSEMGCVALKTVRREIAGDLESLTRFRQEVQCARQVTGTNVCRIHEIFYLPETPFRLGTAFLTMEFLSGVTLYERLAASPVLPMPEVEQIAYDVCRGLQTIHEADIIHRDLKTTNIMLAERKRGTEAVLMDFGLAHEAEAAMAVGADGSTTLVPAKIVGTPAYMAPEQFKGAHATPASDIYALGIVLFQLVTGQMPFEGSTPLSASVSRTKPLPNAAAIRRDLPAKWDRTIQRCLQYQAEDRFQSVSEVIEALNASPQAIRQPRSVSWKLVLLASIVAVVSVLSFLWWRFHSPLSAAPQRRVVVLPFDDLSHNSSDQAFCDGLAEQIVVELTELEHSHETLAVVPASEVRHQKVATASDAYHTFGATIVITGSVLRSGQAIRLFINIIDAKNVKQVRSKEVTVSTSDAAAMQNGVLLPVTDLLDIKLNPEERQLLAQGGTSVPGAYDYYLQGVGYLATGGAGADAAILEFRHAIDSDPNYALAHAGLGRAYWYKYSITRDKTWVDQAWQECRSAIALGPKLSEPHVTLALLNTGTGHYDVATAEAEQAIAIDSKNDQAYTELARALEASGQTDEAEKAIKKAISLRPGSWYNYSRLANFYIKRSRYKDAEEPFAREIELVPDNPSGYLNLGSTYHLEGRYADAERLLKQSIKVHPTPQAYSDLGTVYFFEGKYTEAVTALEAAVANGSKQYFQWGNLADAYRWAPGQSSKARETYLKAIELAKQALDVNLNDAEALSNLGSYYAKLGEKTKALKAMEKALAAEPNNTFVLYDAAITTELVGERTQALNFIKRALLGGHSSNEIAAEPELEKLRHDPLYVATLSRNNGR